MRVLRLYSLPLLALAACSSADEGPTDTGGGQDSGVVADSGVEDTGPAPVDAGPEDMGPADSGPPPTFSIQAIDDARITSRQGAPDFHIARGSADFGEGPFARVTMTVTLGTTCFPFESWQSNPPPEGHNFPANCDAFDRNFEVTIDHPENEDDPPAVELVRAITPFGGPMEFDIDVTDFANGRPGEHEVQMRITTWSDGSGQVTGSDGGWNVSLRFEVEPGPAPRNVLGILPLFNGNHRADTATTSFTFETPPGTTDARLEYRVTGHGGGPVGRACIGPAEEFCRRFHYLSLDGVEQVREDAWRTDCADLCTITRFGTVAQGFDYCAENPTGSIRSVQASRANWCPGDVTPPFNYTWDGLAEPGQHTLSYEIYNTIRGVREDVLEGGSIRMSAVMFFFGD